jgi:hypothetical protein
VLGADVGAPEVARLLVGGEQRRLRVRRERRRDVGALALARLLLELGGDRVGIGVDLVEHVANDAVLERRVKQMVAVEVEASPLDGGPSSVLEQLARRIAEELRDVDALNLPLLGRRRQAAATGAVAEEIREEVVEQTAASETAGHPLLGQIELTEVLGLLGPIRIDPNSRGHRRPAVTLTNRLLGHLVLLLSCRAMNQTA